MTWPKLLFLCFVISESTAGTSVLGAFMANVYLGAAIVVAVIQYFIERKV